MSDEPYDYDPGTPYDPPPSRRRRRRRDYRRESEYDDAWAAADEMADEYDVGPAGLAAGYAWEDSPHYGVNADEGERYWRDDIDTTAPPDPNVSRHPAPPRRGRPGVPPADLGPLPPEVDHMRRRRDQFSPHDPLQVSRRADPRTGDRRRPRPRNLRDESRYRPRPPTYHRDRARRGEYGEYYDAEARARRSHGSRARTPEKAKRRYPADAVPPKPKRKPKPTYTGSVLSGIPTWQLMAIVGMAVIAFLAVAFTCVMLLTVL